MTPDAQQVLCEQASRGDRAAAAELVALSYQRIFGYLRRLSANDHDAADLTQKTFAKAWPSLASYQGRSTFSTWLHGVAYHVYADWRRQHRPGESQSDAWWEAQAADESDPGENAAQRDLGSQLYRWVDELDEEKKQTVHLHYYQGLSLDATAEVLGIATSTVKYRLREALDSLRRKAAEPAFATERKLI